MTRLVGVVALGGQGVGSHELRRAPGVPHVRDRWRANVELLKASLSARFRDAYRCVVPLGPGASVRPSAATSEIPVGELLP